MNAVADEQCALLARLAAINDLIEGHKVTVAMLECERMRLQTKLRLTAYRAPAP